MSGRIADSIRPLGTRIDYGSPLDLRINSNSHNIGSENALYVPQHRLTSR